MFSYNFTIALSLPSAVLILIFFGMFRPGSGKAGRLFGEEQKASCQPCAGVRYDAAM